MVPYALRIPRVTTDRRADRSSPLRSADARQWVRRADHKAARRELAADLRDRCND